MSEWNVETYSGTTLVVRRHNGRGRQLAIARDDAGQINWFETREAAQAHADTLNDRAIEMGAEMGNG